MTGNEILEEAKKQISGHRVLDQNVPERNLDLISAYWTLYKGIEFSAHDVAMMMALLKVARIQNGGGSGDSHVDLVGYGALAGELREESCNSAKENISRTNYVYGLTLSEGECEVKQCEICAHFSHCNEDKIDIRTSGDFTQGRIRYMPGLGVNCDYKPMFTE